MAVLEELVSSCLGNATSQVVGSLSSQCRFVDLFTLGNDPAHQNAMEFIAIVMGLLTLASLGFRGCCVDILDDNMTSLHWSTT